MNIASKKREKFILEKILWVGGVLRLNNLVFGPKVLIIIFWDFKKNCELVMTRLDKI